MPFRRSSLTVVSAMSLAFVVSLTTITCTKSASTSSGSYEEITIAQWGQERYLIYLPLYVAVDKGYFEKRGIKVKIVFSGNDDQTFASVISGQASFGVGDPIFTAISQERGFPAKVVATIVGGVAIWGLTNNPSLHTISSAQDLAGLRIGTFPSPSTNYTLMRQVIEENPSLKNTTIVQAPIGAQLALLDANRADIAMELEPATSIAEAKGYRVVYSSPSFHGPFAFTGLTTTDRLINERPELVRRVVGALEEAVVACHRDPSIATQVGASLFPTIDKKVVEKAVNRMLSEGTFPKHVNVDSGAWQAALRTRLIVGDLHKPQATEVSVNNSFADEARSNT